MDIRTIAEDNLTRHLKQNPYPGRGLVIGRSSAEDAWLLVYWIMGRSTNSQNRRFIAEGSTLRTEPVDLSLVSDPSLIIYLNYRGCISSATAIRRARCTTRCKQVAILTRR
jgi:IMP cyclohydrolase